MMFYTYGQLRQQYILSLIGVILYSYIFSATLLSRNYRMFIIIVLFYGFVLWFVYYVMLGPLWSITGTDALFGSKLIERIVVTGRYPWNDQTLLSHKPEYVYYPSVFMLEALLAIVLNINVKTLWYTPLTMYLCVALVATLIVSLLRSIRSNYIKLLVALPIANWIIFNPV